MGQRAILLQGARIPILRGVNFEICDVSPRGGRCHTGESVRWPGDYSATPIPWRRASGWAGRQARVLEIVACRRRFPCAPSARIIADVFHPYQDTQLSSRTAATRRNGPGRSANKLSTKRWGRAGCPTVCKAARVRFSDCVWQRYRRLR